MSIEDFVTDIERLKVIDESIVRFGVNAQLGKTIEELSELLADIVQYKKYYSRLLDGEIVDTVKLTQIRDNILTERIDVAIMLKDIDLIFNFTYSETKERFDQQFYKLIKYVEASKQKKYT